MFSQTLLGVLCNKQYILYVTFLKSENNLNSKTQTVDLE